LKLDSTSGSAAGKRAGGAKVEDSGFLQHDHRHSRTAPSRFLLAQRVVRDWLLGQPKVAAAFTRDELVRGGGEGKLFQQVQRTFHPRRSGARLLAPVCVPGSSTVSVAHDTHVPLLLIGSGVQHGTFDRPVSPACLASTVAELVGVDYPSANVEQPLREALAK
jgi:hypothetical protein